MTWNGARSLLRADHRDHCTTTAYDRFSLQDLASTPAEYQRLKKRRQLAPGLHTGSVDQGPRKVLMLTTGK